MASFLLPYRGRRKTVDWALDQGRRRGLDFYSLLSDADQAKFAALFVRLADEGQIFNQEKFRNEGSGIYCFKIAGQRLACFFEGNGVYITHGFGKGSIRVHGVEMKRAQRIRTSHEQGGLK